MPREARRALPAGLVPNSSWLLHSGLQEELPDPHSLAACRSPEQPCVTSSGTAEPHQPPQNTPGGPSHSRTPLWRGAGPSPPGGANSTRGSQDPSGPGASLTIKAEKPPVLGTLATGKWGSPLTAGKKVSLSPLVMRKGWKQTNVLGQNSFLLRIT